DSNRVKTLSFFKSSTLFNILLSFLISSVIAILIGAGSYFVVYGLSGKEFTSGMLWEFFLYFQTVTWPFMALSQLITLRAQAKASYNRVEEFLDQPITLIDSENKVDEITGKISFKNLSFKYPDSDIDSLNNLSFDINPGEMVGIIGNTGSGKTTIVNLLLRIYNVNKNSLFLDDKDIMDIRIKDVRNAIGYVPQDNFLFSDSISNNIAFALEDTSNNKDIVEASLLSDVHSNIMEFEQKYDTILGERGVTLSGGQKQRVSIARALIKNPSILILDDSVSAVDSKTENTIIENLKSLRKDKTTILITHRISSLEQLDKVILIKDGTIIGVGTHEQLIKTNEEYIKMAELQLLEKKLEGSDF
ncbi:MAG: ABC transporter ATP-binding protein, partial [Anaeroplasmataceae bacterium]